MQPEPITTGEMIADLTARIDLLEQLLKQRDEIIARAVIAQITSENILEELIKRVAAAVEAEWTGKFLPELRTVMMRRLEEMESIVLPGGTGPTRTN